MPPWGLGLALFAGAAAVGVAALVGLLNPERTGVGRRIPAGRDLAPLTGVVFAALVVWLVLPSLYFRPGPVEPGQPVGTQPAGAQVHPREMIVVNAAVPSLAFAVLVAGDALVRARVGQRLGFAFPRLPRGVVAGVIGIALAIPMVYAASAAAEYVYRTVGYQHPSEHGLLRVMAEGRDPLIKYLAIFAAVVVAPLWEELLFRGHVQTLIRESLIRFRHGVLDAPDARPHPRESWAAVVLASILFAGVHDLWMFPPIFVLSLCLGFAYERTNNLWAPVVMHASFNGIMTAYFLSRLP